MSGLIHNWLYSFLPINRENYPALVGFCKNCRNTFVYFMPIHDPWTTTVDFKSNLYQQFDSQIPKYGCVPIDDLPPF